MNRFDGATFVGRLLFLLLVAVVVFGICYGAIYG